MLAMHPFDRVALSPFDRMHHPFVSARMLERALLGHDVADTCRPRARLETTEDKHVVSLVAPGIAPADVTCEVHDGRLALRGQNKRKRVDATVSLPHDADATSATCEVSDGLITVSLKRRQPVRVSIAVSNMEGDSSSSDEEKDTYSLSLVAAGFSAADLNLSVEGSVLKVDGESTRTGAHLRHRARLPRDADVKATFATHIDGILTVTVPKTPAAEPRRIAINAEPVTTAEFQPAAEAMAEDKEAAPSAESPIPTAEKQAEDEVMDEEAVMV